MSSDVKYNVIGETNAEDVANRVKASAHSIEKQIEGIGNKFKTAFKDIFLSFLGPMALLTTVLSYISGKIAENKKNTQDAIDLAAKGENQYVSEETASILRDKQARDADKKLKEQAEISKQQATEEYLRNNEERVMKELGILGYIKYATASYEYGSKQSDVQDVIQRLQAEDMKKQGGLLTGVKPTDFKGPEGFSNIVGVGANPVLEAMTAQLEEQKRQTYLLEKIASGGPGNTDFTKENTDNAPKRRY